MKNYKNLREAIHKEGYIFIFIAIVITLLLSSINTNVSWLCFLATCFVIFFFRNPDRVTPNNDNLVIAPADGLIVDISEATPPEELNIVNPMRKISIFLNIFNVHVNRIPISGRVVALNYHAGKFLNASLDKASILNERQSVLLEHASKTQIVVVQIAGLIARRIVCDLEKDAEVFAGARFGIIRFGSRVDVYLPLNVEVLVAKGQTAIGGETVLANLSSLNAQQEFVMR